MLMKKILSLLTLLMLTITAAKAADATFDFQNNTLNLPVGEGQTFEDGALSNPVTVNGVTLTNVQGDAFYPAIMMKDNSGVISLNVYKNGAIKFNAPEGKAIVKLIATMKSKTFSQMTASTGATTDNEWTGNATEVTFSASALMSFLQIEVFLADENSETVKPAANTFDLDAENIAAFNAAEDGKVVKLTLSNARVNGTYNGYYVEDASGATVIKGIDLTVGTAINGYIIGTKSTDTGIDYVGYEPAPFEPQLTATDASTFEVTATTLVGTVMPVANAGQQANYGRLITVENVTISGSGRNKTLTDNDGNTLTARDYMGVLPADYTWPEKASKVTGVVIYYMTGWFLMPISAEAIEVEGQQPSTVLFDFANNNLNLPVGTAEDVNAGDLGGKSIAADGVTLKFVNAMTMPTRYYLNGNRGNQLQAIAGGQVRVTAPQGYAVTAIVSTGNPATNATTGAITYQTNWEIVKGGGSLTAANQETQTWTGNAESVLLNAKGPNYLNAITVILAAVNNETALLANEEADSYAEVSGLAAFNEAANNALVKLTLTDAVITSTMINGWGYYVQDATAGANIYCTGLNFEVGDKLNGTIYVKKNNQNMGARICMTEATNAEGLTIAKNADITPIEGTINEINVAANKCRVVKLSGVAVKGTAETAATITDASGATLAINNGKTNYYPYVIQESLADIDYSNATVVGILFGSNATTNQLMPLSITSNTVDGITAAEGDEAQKMAVYSLQGVRQKSLKRGINIVNGRKVMMK